MNTTLAYAKLKHGYRISKFFDIREGAKNLL